MNPLQEAIRLLSKEEVRAFKLFVQKVNVQAGRKDVDLFDQIRKSGAEYDEDAAFQRLYSGTSKNTFHRLKSRLLYDINRCMVDLMLDNNDILRLWHFLSVVEYYLLRSHHELAHWFLRKAENLAQKLGHLEALEIIYGYYIRLSHQVTDIDPEHFIQRRRENAQELQRVRDLDDLLALAVYRTKVAQTYGGSAEGLMETLERTVQEIAIDDQRQLSPSMKIKLFQSISSVLLDRQDFPMLEIYVQETLRRFEEEGIFSRYTHETKLRMLSYLANVLHKNGKFQESLKAAEQLGREMKSYDALYQDRYLFFFYNALFVNYFITDIPKALRLLEEMREITSIMDSPFHALFVEINTALVHNQVQEYKKAIKHIVQAQLRDGYKAADPGLQLRVCVAELMIRLKLEQTEVIEQRIRQLQHDFEDVLTRQDFEREREMMALISRLSEAHSAQDRRLLQKQIQQFLKHTAPPQDEKVELIGYNDFLRDYLGS